MRHSILRPIGFALAFALTAQAYPQANTPGSATSPAETSLPQPVAFEPSWQEFVARAARSNLAEIEAAQLALARSGNPAVRSFAQQMVEERQKSNERLRAIAEARKVQMPTDTDLIKKVALKGLQDKSGAPFDAAYVAQIQKDHDRSIALFKAAVASSKIDAQVKAVAAETLPTLERRRAELSQLASAE